MKMSARLADWRFLRGDKRVERCSAAGTPSVVPERLMWVMIVAAEGFVSMVVCLVRSEGVSSLRPGVRVKELPGFAFPFAMVMLQLLWTARRLELLRGGLNMEQK